MLTRDQKTYVYYFVALQKSVTSEEAIHIMNTMDDLYAGFSWNEMNEVEEWIDRYQRGEDTEDISGLGYEPDKWISIHGYN